MGHIYLGDLPRTQRWNAVVAGLDDASSAPLVAALTLKAAGNRLDRLQGDPSLTYCFWLLVRLAAAARGEQFQSNLGHLGIVPSADESVIGFIAQIATRTRETTAAFHSSGPFGELAALSLRRTLMETVGTESQSLFASSVEDLERAFRRHSSATQFGELALRFFGDFYARILRFYVDRARLNVQGGGRTGGLPVTQQFRTDLDLHARQAARYVEGFAVDWYRRELRLTDGMITRDQAQAFITGAMRKMRAELNREARA
jgi:hypothetical protein